MKFIIYFVCFIGIIFFSSSVNENYQYIMSNIFSILFVFGGTLISTLISYPVERVKRIKVIVEKAFRTRRFNFPDTTRLVIQVTREYKRLGFKSLENSLKDFQNPYLKHGVKLIADSCKWEHIRSTLEKELMFDILENDSAQRILRAMAKYAPAFGLIGTIIGLMRIFPQLTNPENIGGSISLALLTTLYGVILSNLVFLPLANKLKDNSSEDELVYRYILEALQCIQKREYSIVTEQKLSALMPKHELSKYHANKVRHLHLKMAENS